MDELEDKKQIFKKSIFRIKLNLECGILDILWLESFFIKQNKRENKLQNKGFFTNILS